MHRQHWITSGRAALATYAVGQGRPVVFLHANVCDSRMWHDQMHAVGIGGTAIAYDRRGFGNTRAEPEAFSSVADLMAVMDGLAANQPAILVGCSQDGRIALDAALQHPARVQGLLLVAPGIAGAPEPVYPPEIGQTLARQNAAQDAGDLDQVNAIKARLWLDGPLAPEGRVTGQARQLFLDMNGTALRAPPVGTNLDTAPTLARLHELRIPSRIIWGNLDFPHIQDRCRHLAATIPAASAHELPGAAHLPSLEQPAMITSLLTSFLRNVG